MPPDPAAAIGPVAPASDDLSRRERRQRQIDRMAIAKVRDEEANENRRRYCVYVHRDSRDHVRYVGHGLRERAWSVNGRPRPHRWMLACGDLLVEVLHDHLTAREAIDTEAALIERLRREHPTLLLNRLRGTHLEETQEHG